MSTTTNYTRDDVEGQLRKVDLYMMGPLSFGDQSMQATAPTLNVETGGQVCAGIVKLAQKVVSVLLSYNVYYDFDWGTRLFPFIAAGSAGNIRAILGPLLADAAESVVNDIRSGETEDMPSDERIKNLYSQDFIYDKASSSVIVMLDVLSQADIVTAIVVPVSIVP